jgi:hypothetical protein
VLNRDLQTATGEEGTASVELVAVIPFLLIAALAAAQLGLVGQALWSAGIAARAGARADLVGGSATEAARRALPPSLRRGAVVHERDHVSIRAPVPRILPFLPRIAVGARTRLDADG